MKCHNHGNRFLKVINCESISVKYSIDPQENFTNIHHLVEMQLSSDSESGEIKDKTYPFTCPLKKQFIYREIIKFENKKSLEKINGTKS